MPQHLNAYFRTSHEHVNPAHLLFYDGMRDERRDEYEPWMKVRQIEMDWIGLVLALLEFWMRILDVKASSQARYRVEMD